MPHEIKDATAFDATKSSANSSEAANQLFANPADFLQTLKKDFHGITKGEGNAISLPELVTYSEHGSDSKGRAVAKIASDHFKDLEFMGQQLDSFSGPPGITEKQLVTDLELVTGQTSGLVTKVRLADAALGVGSGFAALAAGSIAVATITQVPPVAVFIGGEAAILGAAMLAGLDAACSAKNRVEGLAVYDQAMISGWLHSAATGATNSAAIVYPGRPAN